MAIVPDLTCVSVLLFDKDFILHVCSGKIKILISVSAANPKVKNR